MSEVVGKRARWSSAWACWALLACAFDWPGRTARLLVELAQTEDLDTRLDLIRLLGQRPEPAAEGALVELCQDARSDVRQEAVRGLCGRGAEPAWAALLRASTDPDVAVRGEAAHCLPQLGADRALAPLLRLLGDGQADVRLRAVRALGVLHDAGAAAPLAVALDDESSEVRAAAAESLAALGAPSALSALSARLHDPAPEVRASVVLLLAELDPLRAEAAVLDGLDDAHESVRLAALRAAASLPHPPGGELAERLGSLATNPDQRLAAGAALALRRVSLARGPAPFDREPRAAGEASSTSDPAWLTALTAAAQARPEQYDVLLQALERSLPPGASLAVDPLLLWFDRASPQLRARIAVLIARARPRDPAKLLPLLRDPDWIVRRAAAQALAHANAPISAEAEAGGSEDEQTQADAALWSAALHDVPSVARVAARALGARCAQAEPRRRAARAAQLLEALPGAQATARQHTLLTLAGCLDPGPSGAASSLSAQQLAEAIPTLAGALHDADPVVASLAARALAGIAAPSTWAALRDAYEGAPTTVRVAILRASRHVRAADAVKWRADKQRSADARLAVTAAVASWLAGDPVADPLPAWGQNAPWPRGPVAAFLAADPQLPPSAEREARLCAALSEPEPSTRANAFAALLRANAACASARAATWLRESRVWPVRLAAARALGAQNASADDEPGRAAALNACRVDPEPRVRRSCAGPDSHAVPEAEPETAARSSFEALVLEDGRVLISARDGAGDASWPELRRIVAENPWRWAYASE